jgi:hypothetical protein
MRPPTYPLETRETKKCLQHVSPKTCTSVGDIGVRTHPRGHYRQPRPAVSDTVGRTDSTRARKTTTPARFPGPSEGARHAQGPATGQPVGH